MAWRKATSSEANDRQLREMIRTLLEDRFKLSIRRDKRDMQAYAITVGNTPPKLARNETNPNGLPSLLFKGLGMLPVVNATMSDFARVMQTAVLDRGNPCSYGPFYGLSAVSMGCHLPIPQSGLLDRCVHLFL